MSRKTAIVSCYFQPNYGSMLQALATQMALDSLGYENETIDISGFNNEIKKAKLLYFLKASFTSTILFTKIGRARDAVIRRMRKNEYTKNMSIRNSAFKRFEEKYFKMSPIFNSKKELGDNCGRYYAILVGSDQLWLPGNIAADYYTLNWVGENVNTIAYATSFGQSCLPSGSEKLAKVFLNKIRHISVREQSGANLVKKISGRKVPVVCDPTLLFDGKEWSKIQDKKAIIDKEYIFVYFLGSNPVHREFVKRLRNETGLTVVCLPHIDEYVKEDEECSDIRLYDIDPGQFLNLIRNARYVCTDSFHCSVFSIQYEKEFFTFRRFASKNKQSTNSRLDTLFQITDIRGRLLSGNESISCVLTIKTDYKDVNARLKNIREFSYGYLIRALEDKGSTDCD